MRVEINSDDQVKDSDVPTSLMQRVISRKPAAFEGAMPDDDIVSECMSHM